MGSWGRGCRFVVCLGVFLCLSEKAELLGEPKGALTLALGSLHSVLEGTRRSGQGETPLCLLEVGGIFVF